MEIKDWGPRENQKAELYVILYSEENIWPDNPDSLLLVRLPLFQLPYKFNLANTPPLRLLDYIFIELIRSNSHYYLQRPANLNPYDTARVSVPDKH